MQKRLIYIYPKEIVKRALYHSHYPDIAQRNNVNGYSIST